MTNRAGTRVIVLADHWLAKRKRARHFWGTMGEVLRIEDRRHARVDNGFRSANNALAVRVDARAPRSN